uniref:RHS repeat-associated core domain-containing protein n=1 Tax=Serratia proteamaculans TaxID=28151 RepID=UPI001F4BEFE0|nr:RHS repeat-associated core domain-containing protein [Serratia proteamaculans]
MSTSLFGSTPSVAVLDNRGLLVRELQYHRHPDTPEETDERITCHQHDERGSLSQSADPRLHAAGLTNFTYLNSLTGTVLQSVSADAGTSLVLSDAAGRAFLVVTGAGTEDAVTRTWQYEDDTLPGRPLSITEQVTGEAAQITERFVYAGNTDAEKMLNLVGQCVSHYDTAGLVQTDSIALSGVPLAVTRQLLPDTAEANWVGEDVSAWNDLLDGETFFTQTHADATGAVLSITDGADDSESYRYDGDSQRVLKISVQKTGTSTQTQRVQYLPGLELRSTKAGNTETEGLQVITVGEAGRAQVRGLHWESGKPAEISNNQLRWSYDNLIGSSNLELDGDGNIISMEEYYPYGGTAVWTARSAVEADYKTIRYSGKERDATGLDYYGYRYYQSWSGRWLSADPAGTIDGLNLFRMVRNNPVTLMDNDGLAPGNRYIYFPMIHEKRILRITYENAYREAVGKSLVIPVVEESKMSLFRRAVDDHFLQDKGGEYIEKYKEPRDKILSRVVSDLEGMTPDDHFIINAHGHAGDPRFHPDRGFDGYYEKNALNWLASHAETQAEILVNTLHLKEFSVVKVSTCHGAEGSRKGISMPFTIRDKGKMLEYVRGKRGDFSTSLAGALESSLIKLQPNREVGHVYGYLGETTIYGDFGKKIALTDNGVLTRDTHKGKNSIFSKRLFGDKAGDPIVFKRSLTRTNAHGIVTK